MLVNIAPLNTDKTTIASFALNREGCGSIGRVLLNDVPACRAGAGNELDCLTGIAVSSRDGIALFK